MTSHHIGCAVVFFFALVIPQQARAGLQETFAEANAAFWSGHHEDAAESYEQLISLGVRDVDLFYNLGTAYARQGRLGHAIVNYERALKLDPSHEDSQHNLAQVRQGLARARTDAGQDADLTPPQSFWLSFLSRITPGQVGLPFLICYVLFFAVAIARTVTRRELARLVLLIVAIIVGLGGAVSATLLVSKTYFDRNVRQAVVVNPEATLYEGPGEEFRHAFDAREGDRLRIVEQESEWVLLRNPEGREGWGQREDFGDIVLD